jgi:hypothetical protein
MRVKLESPAKSRVTLSASHRKSIRGILADASARSSLSHKQRSAIRELCAQVRHLGEREQVLNALNVALVEVANQARIPYGANRNELLAEVAGVFAEEVLPVTASGRIVRPTEPAVTAATGKADGAVKRVPRRALINCSTPA